MLKMITELYEHMITPLVIFVTFWLSLRTMGLRAVSELSTFDWPLSSLRNTLY